MPNILNPSCYQDDIGAILSTPLGSENVTPFRPWSSAEQVDELRVTSVGDVSPQPVSSASTNFAGTTIARTGALVLAMVALTGAGLFAWLR